MRCRLIIRKTDFKKKDRSRHFDGNGTIYQSSNASYYLRSTPRKLDVLPDGSVLNARTASKIRNLERGWRYAANILVRHGATEPPPADPDNTKPLRLWLDYWTTLLTRPLFHLGNHRYAWSIHPSITLPHSAPYPKWPKAAPLMIHEANDYQDFLLATPKKAVS
jgi:hypothetical protein